MAGVGGNSANGGIISYYLYTNDYVWSMSPYDFGYNNSSVLLYSIDTNFYHNSVNYLFAGLRPSVSLKHGTEFLAGGDGTPLNPYVVKYN